MLLIVKGNMPKGMANLDMPMIDDLVEGGLAAVYNNQQAQPVNAIRAAILAECPLLEIWEHDALARCIHLAAAEL